jgi:signal transduction histidine kinase
VKPYSLKRRLIASVLLIELVSAICVCALAFAYEHHARFRSFDIMLHGRADSLLGAVQDAEDAHDNVMLDGSEATLPASDIYEVWDQNLRILGKSPNWNGIDPSQFPGRSRKPGKISVAHKTYGAILISGVRNVDPGDKGGGIPRTVQILYGSPLGPVWDSIWEAVEFYAWSSIVLLFLTGAVMYWLLNRELAPLRELAQQATQVSVTSWTFQPSSQVTRTTELAPLAQALQTLLAGLERSFSRQRQFVGDAAHELKTAVSVLKSSLQLLTMKPRTADEYHAGLERCHADCERMEQIVAGMLTLARVEEDPASDHPISHTDLTRALRNVTQQLDSLAHVRQVPVLLSTTDNLFVAMEVSQLELLFTNILANSLQHSPPHHAIDIVARLEDSRVAIEFTDHGEGIDAGSLPFVFDRFYRSDPSRSRQTGGAGLGLSICQAIVTSNEGTIQITSELGKGTCVLVRLPALFYDTRA